MTERETVYKPRQTCPTWCVECSDENAGDGFRVHHGPVRHASVYEEDTAPIPVTVRASFFDTLPESMNRHPTAMDHPMVDVDFDNALIGLRLTPTQARELATALIQTADTVDP
jgi:hypothetical protein